MKKLFLFFNFVFIFFGVFLFGVRDVFAEMKTVLCNVSYSLIETCNNFHFALLCDSETEIGCPIGLTTVATVEQDDYWNKHVTKSSYKEVAEKCKNPIGTKYGMFSKNWTDCDWAENVILENENEFKKMEVLAFKEINSETKTEILSTSISAAYVMIQGRPNKFDIGFNLPDNDVALNCLVYSGDGLKKCSDLKSIIILTPKEDMFGWAVHFPNTNFLQKGDKDVILRVEFYAQSIILYKFLTSNPFSAENVRKIMTEKTGKYDFYFTIRKKSGGETKDTSVSEFKIPPVDGLNNLQVDSIQDLIGNSIKTAMGLLGSIAFVMFVYGGVLWMTSMGNSEKSKKSTQIIIWTSLGMIVILASWTIMEFVFSAF